MVIKSNLLCFYSVGSVRIDRLRDWIVVVAWSSPVNSEVSGEAVEYCFTRSTVSWIVSRQFVRRPVRGADARGVRGGAADTACGCTCREHR